MQPLALLDDGSATALRPTSRLYTGYVREHRCTDPRLLDSTCAAVEADQHAGLHAVLLADYEWGVRLQGLAPRHADGGGNEGSGALRVLMFGHCQRLSRDEASAWLAAQEGSEHPAGTLGLQASVERAAFTQAIEHIHQAIAAGETYQVNYTYRLHGAAYGPPLALYRRLRALQPVAYGAYLVLPPGEQDSTCVAQDVKNRAENLMIVDLLRNDLGRVAQIGTVRVPELFAVEPYATLFQMTSTVQAQLRPDVDLATLLRATFPCGSITGAPKRHTMEIIDQLETTPRGLYCGAIGWLEAPAEGRRLGDLCLSVAIRTLTLQAEDAGQRPLRLGVGAGIVMDSRPGDEFDECRLKARFLTAVDPGFELLETVRALPDGDLPHLQRHLARLAASAAALGFALDPDEARLALLDAAQAGRGHTRRLRLALAHNGRLTLTQAPLTPLPEAAVNLRVARWRLPDSNPLAAHKTSHRAAYDAAVREQQAVEGGRSSVFLRLDGRWCTPPVADGALPGVMRSVLLEDPAWAATERRLHAADLLRAEQIVVCNALRGVLPARLLQPATIRP